MQIQSHPFVFGLPMKEVGKPKALEKWPDHWHNMIFSRWGWDLVQYPSAQLQRVSGVSRRLLHVAYGCPRGTNLKQGKLSEREIIFILSLAYSRLYLKFPIKRMYQTTYINLYYGHTSRILPHNWFPFAWLLFLPYLWKNSLWYLTLWY